MNVLAFSPLSYQTTIKFLEWRDKTIKQVSTYQKRRIIGLKLLITTLRKTSSGCLHV